LPQPIDHSAFISKWLKTLSPKSPHQVEKALHHALSLVWHRSHVTLGEVTLTAIVERVLYGGYQTYPWLKEVVVSEHGPNFDSISKNPDSELHEGLQYVLVELLNVLGKLTAEALTHHLYSELAKVKHIDVNPLSEVGSKGSNKSGSKKI
jgi:hypothetical protein